MLAPRLLENTLGELGIERTPENVARYAQLAQQIADRFERLRAAASESDVLRVLEEAPEKIQETRYTASPLGTAVARRARLLWQMLHDIRAARFDAPWATISAITAALLYLITEVDVVPDPLPVAGLFDDQLVIALAADAIRQDLERYAKAMEFALAEYGLQ